MYGKISTNESNENGHSLEFKHDLHRFKVWTVVYMLQPKSIETKFVSGGHFVSWFFINNDLTLTLIQTIIKITLRI